MSRLGTEFKINVHIDRLDGFSMDDIEFECEFYTFRNRKTVVKKQDMVRVDQDNYLAMIDSSELGVGTIICRVIAYIPDADFDDGFRTEVEEVSTGITIVR